ncbi:GDNF family receptor alpha-1 [Merluccius polli]|uniref:GDNF family receptor alpha-1 n=1 Tax=Merluccius polli TaxID=89951 RepID=A0AA47NQQ9_MERPO|nr:GDNF family receptor alpha-1 [Merluccius polli]
MILAALCVVLPLLDVWSCAEDAAHAAHAGSPSRLDCVKASEQCLKEQACSTKYRTMRQCVAGGKESNFSMVAGFEAKDECRSAMDALKQSPLYNCRCKRGMKKEKNCLRIYWGMYQTLQGNDFLEDSPYEPVNSRLSDIFRLAPILGGTRASLSSAAAAGSRVLPKEDCLASPRLRRGFLSIPDLVCFLCREVPHSGFLFSSAVLQVFEYEGGEPRSSAVTLAPGRGGQGKASQDRELVLGRDALGRGGSPSSTQLQDPSRNRRAHPNWAILGNEQDIADEGNGNYGNILIALIYMKEVSDAVQPCVAPDQTEANAIGYTTGSNGSSSSMQT